MHPPLLGQMCKLTEDGTAVGLYMYSVVCNVKPILLDRIFCKNWYNQSIWCINACFVLAWTELVMQGYTHCYCTLVVHHSHLNIPSFHYTSNIHEHIGHWHTWIGPQYILHQQNFKTCDDSCLLCKILEFFQHQVKKS